MFKNVVMTNICPNSLLVFNETWFGASKPMIFHTFEYSFLFFLKLIGCCVNIRKEHVSNER